MAGPVVLLTGGTGGAKLAVGLQALLGDELVCVCNTGDDVEIHGAHVSPDPDLVTFHLAGLIDERGWGLRDDTFHAMDMLRAVGDDVWFNLGDRDLALCLRRARRLAEGATLTEVLDEHRRALAVAARVVPMSDDPVRTEVRVDDGWVGVQDFLIRRRGATPRDIRFVGVDRSAPGAAAVEAIRAARLVVVGPSNPVLSLAPVVVLLSEEIEERTPVVAVSPIVGGAVLKGPTAAFLAMEGRPVTAQGVRDSLGIHLDAMVADEEVEDVRTVLAGTRMDDPEAAKRLAQVVLDAA